MNFCKAQLDVVSVLIYCNCVSLLPLLYLFQVERPRISVVYDDLAAHVFTDSHEIDVVLQGGDIQAVSEEIIRMSGTISDITTLVSASMSSGLLSGIKQSLAPTCPHHLIFTI